MNPKFYVIPGWKVRARVAAAAFLPAQGAARHQAAYRDERSKARSIIAEGGIPLVERFDRRLQQRRFTT